MYVYIYMVTPPPKTNTFEQFTAICDILLIFSMFKYVFFLASILYLKKNV